MDYHHETTTLPDQELSPWQDLGAATVLTCSPPPTRARKTIPRIIHEMIGELKVRFQHGCANDPEGFKARCALLAEDLADAPPLLLRLAIAQWVRESPFLPTAADLTRIMRDELERRDRAAAPASPPPGYDWAQSFCDQRNATIVSKRSATDDRQNEWFVDGSGNPQMRSVQRAVVAQSRVDPCDVDRLNRALRKYGAPFRYNRAGYDFDLPKDGIDPTDKRNTKE